MTSISPRTAFMGNPPSPEYRPRKRDIVDVLEQMQAISAVEVLKDFHPDVGDLPTEGNETGDKRAVLASEDTGGGVYRWAGDAWNFVSALPVVLTESLSAQQAEVAKQLARQWANRPEDEPVEGGEFSARHHSAKAAAHAAASEVSKISSQASSVAAGAASGRLDASFAELATKFNYTGEDGRQLAAPGDVVLWRGLGLAFLVLESGAVEAGMIDNTGSGGIKLRALGATVSLLAYGAVGDFNTTTQTGTDNSAAIERARGALNAGRINTLFIPEGKFFTSTTIGAITREGARIIGVGGATRRSSIVVGATSGTALTIQARGCWLEQIHIGATDARYAAGNPTTAGGITDGHGILIGVVSLTTLGRTILRGVFVEAHPTDGIVVASSVEMSGWEDVTVAECLRHAYAIGDGQVVAGFASSTRGAFHCDMGNLRAFECGGHALYMPSAGHNAIHIFFRNFQALGCMWKIEHDQSGSLRQIIASGQGMIFDRLDIEDQQYANSTTSGGRPRVALAAPSRGIVAGSRAYFLHPYFSSLRAGIIAAGPGVSVIEPRSFVGAAYGNPLDILIEFTSGSQGCLARVTSSMNAATQLVRNLSTTSDITIDGVQYFPTNISSGDIAKTRTPVNAQIVAGALPSATVTATTLRVLERDRTPTGADAFATMFANASYDGLVIDLIADTGVTITVTNGTASGASNKGFVLGADRVLTGNNRLRVEYIHALDAWYEIAFFE